VHQTSKLPALVRREFFVPPTECPGMKLFLQFLVAIILHPVALLLMLLNLLGRTDLDGGKKIIWALVGLLWGIGPILYILIGEGSLW